MVVATDEELLSPSERLAWKFLTHQFDVAGIPLDAVTNSEIAPGRLIVHHTHGELAVEAINPQTHQSALTFMKGWN